MPDSPRFVVPKEAPTIIPETESGNVRNLAAANQALIFFIHIFFEAQKYVLKRAAPIF